MPSTGGGKGVTVAGFEPELSEIYSGETVNFRLLLKNEGSADAKNVYAELLGIDESWCGPEATTNCESSQGGSLEKLPNEEECKYTKSGFTLLAPNPYMGTSGSQHICTWTYKSPKLSKGYSVTYTPSVRVFYSYTSAVSKLITFGSSRELKNLQDKGSSLIAETKSQTSGPIAIDIVSSGPIRFMEAEKKVTFPIQITINNAGDGTACAYDSYSPMQYACKAVISKEKNKELKNRVRVKIDLGANMEFANLNDCGGFKQGKAIPLYKGDTNTFVCDIIATGLSTTAQVQRLVAAEAIYEYFADTATTIKVTGTN